MTTSERQQPVLSANGSAPQPAPAVGEKFARKPALPGLTGIRTCLALTILLFHFTPAGLRWEAHPWLSLYPIVDIGFVFVSFFFLISGFILSYNYDGQLDRMNAPDFWMARFSRLYPVYLFTLLVSIPFLLTEWHVRSHRHFWEGAILTPLLLQGCFPHLATFWNTVTWTLSCDVLLYLAFPYLLRLPWPRKVWMLTLLLLCLWVIGMVPHTVYILRDPDHFGRMATRFDDGTWINVLKYTPWPYICTFLCGLTLGKIQARSEAMSVRTRTMIGLCGFAGAYAMAYHIAPRIPYVLVHGGLLTPVFCCVILGLAGTTPWARVFSWAPLVAIGSSTYCLYLLHFNLFVLLHLHHIPERLGVARFDPWFSYVAVVVFAMLARRFVEKPGQKLVSGWWKRKRQGAGSRDQGTASVPVAKADPVAP